MRLADIRAELVRRGLSFASIARELGRSKVHVREVAAGKRRSANVEEAIAAAIERPVDEVFEPTPNGAAA